MKPERTEHIAAALALEFYGARILVSEQQLSSDTVQFAFTIGARDGHPAFATSVTVSEPAQTDFVVNALVKIARAIMQDIQSNRE